MTDTEQNLRYLNTKRVVAAGRAAGWSDSDLGALLGLFDPALIRTFAGDDVYLHDNRLVGRVGVVSTQYDKEAWVATLDSLDATPRA
jgi:hypothetical protein